MYTPKLRETNQRLYIRNPQFSSDFKHTRGSAYKGVVTDTDTGKSYKIYGAACSSPSCQCDAIATPISK